jgi:hypothetical protein
MTTGEHATLAPARGGARAVAAVSAASDGPVPVTGVRTCCHGMRSPVYDVMPRHATCNLAIIWP